MNVIYIILIAAFATPLLMALRASALRRRTTPAAERGPTGPFLPPAEMYVTQSLDLGALLQMVAAGLAAFAHDRYVRIDVATVPGRMVRANPAALRDLLHDMIVSAILAATGGQVLVSVSSAGGDLCVVVTDDGAGPREDARDRTLRDSADLIAQLGATCAMEVHPGKGTVVTLRLPPLQPRTEICDTIRAEATLAAFG